MTNTTTDGAAPGALSLTRRRFLQWSAAAGGPAAGAMGLGGCGLQPSEDAKPAAGPGVAGLERLYRQLRQAAALRLAVVDGTIVPRVDPDNTGDDKLGSQQIRACVRGRSIRQRIYSPERLKKPLKRVGKRGEDKWQEIELGRGVHPDRRQAQGADHVARQRVDLPQLRHRRPRCDGRHVVAAARDGGVAPDELHRRLPRPLQWRPLGRQHRGGCRLPLRRLAGRTATTTPSTPSSW